MSTPQQGTFAQALLDPSAPVPVGWVAHNGSNPLPRFNVYRNNVVVSLMQALRDSFPALAAELGGEPFDAWALQYLRAHPPTDAVLTTYGDGLADFLATRLPTPQRWLCDLARLEMARIHAFHAADMAPLDGQVLLALTTEPERLAGTRIGLLPDVTVVRSDGPVFDAWSCHSGDHPRGTHGPQSVLVAREDWEVVVIAIDTGTALLVQALQQGLALGDALEQAAADHPDFDVVQALALLIRQRCLGSVTPPPPTH